MSGLLQHLVTRKAWGARPPRSTSRLAPAAVRYLVVHYSAMDADEQVSHVNCPGRVRGIQNYHMDSHGWADVAYNWVVCKHGYIFRGRGWRVRSAATGPANGFSVAVCFLGDDTRGRDDATAAGREAIRSVHRFVGAHAPNLEGVRGHRDFMATSCPGDELYRFARSLK
ncbi:MAG: N-acetylmuramoyl-L-alanine amidase [Gemmatimonadaceae bacterium]|nr:N-acetylmuramoyl-L-alanine amidase [Gemmatimonadaceae bacterium]